ncbi:hypothetical protein [Paenibacillus xylanivorans]|uniref:hypothetical protein n=1 Tax=Paenibacillus xylanivorans TaxID=1705561 RepID=UPI000A9B0155|nr:hypothetical protein [Paenibacillus xylanivorans]
MKKKSLILSVILAIALVIGAPLNTTSYADDVQPAEPTPIVAASDSHGEGGW